MGQEVESMLFLEPPLDTSKMIAHQLQPRASRTQCHASSFLEPHVSTDGSSG